MGDMLFDAHEIPIVKPQRELIDIDQRATSVGAAGEYLVCHDMQMHGIMASISPVPGRTDIFCEAEDGTLFTVQVKTVRRPYCGNVSRGYQFSSGSSGAKPGEFSLVACVALDIKTIAYIPGHIAKQSMSIGLPNAPRSRGGQGQGRKSVYECIDSYPLSAWLDDQGIKWRVI